MEAVLKGLAPILAGGLALQQLLEFLGQFLDAFILKPGQEGDNDKEKKRKEDERKNQKSTVLSITALVIGILLTAIGGFRVLAPLGYAAHPWFDGAVTALVISGGTEGINSIVKFLGYTKEKQKAEAKESGAGDVGGQHQ